MAVKSLESLGERGHHDPTVPDLLENISQDDDDEDVRVAADEALSKVRAKLTSHREAG